LERCGVDDAWNASYAVDLSTDIISTLLSPLLLLEFCPENIEIIINTVFICILLLHGQLCNDAKDQLICIEYKKAAAEMGTTVCGPPPPFLHNKMQGLYFGLLDVMSMLENCIFGCTNSCSIAI
jgi:hypothetical protein